MHRKIGIAGLVLGLLCGTKAYASFHLWQFSEIYSNAAGTQQFIEFSTSAAGQEFLSGHTLASSGHQITFATDLPGDSANRHFLAATSAFATAHGITPDYILPSNFFNPAGDTLNFAGGFDVLNLTPGLIPTDGLHSYLPQSHAAAIGSADNFAGAVAVVPEPSGLGLLGVAGVALLRRKRRTD